MIKKILFISLTLPVLIFSQYKNFPNPLSNTIWLGIGGGATYYKGDFPNTKIDFYGRGEFEYFFESNSRSLFGLKVFSGYGSLYGSSNTSLSIGSPSRNSLNYLTYFMDVGTGLTYLINYNSLHPYFSLGFYSVYWSKVLDQSRNNVYDKKRDIKFGFFGEGGIKIKLSEGLTLNFSGILNYPNSDEIDGRISSNKDVFFTALAGFSTYFGGFRDTDKDGIPDKFDLCPYTPPNVKVDEFGCPVAKIKDSDGDGIEDKFDKCPDTPENVVVDQNGCPVDSDGDGVPDYLDKCPGTHSGFAVDEKGCPLDSDKDGVLDAFDKCPDTPQNTPVDDSGCPNDSDGDGVPDSLDKCKNSPPGVKVNEDGCAEEEISKQQQEQIFVLQGMTTFQLGKSTLTENAKEELKKLSEIIKKYPDSKWRIEGHTDSQGSSEFNRKLSQERADAVKKYLVSLGISEKMLIAEGMGEDYPIADNKTEEGRQKNRRVVITKIK